MAIITTLFLLFLFLIGLVSTLSNIPTKKITSFLQSKPQSPIPPKSQTTPIKSQSQQTKNQNQKLEMAQKRSSNPPSTERKAELKSVFATFDKNKDGFITKQELSDSLHNIGISTGETDVVEMVRRVDANGDGLIDFDEFCDLFESMVGQEDQGGLEGLDHDQDGELREAFDVFDGDRNGLISVEELGLVLDSLGFKEGKKMEDCKEMIKKVDIDGDGMIDFHEFKNMMKNGVSLISVS